MRRLGFAVMTVVLLGTAALGRVQSREPTLVRVALFGAQAPFEFVLGQEKGFFDKFGARVVVETRWTSKELRDGLAAGQFDIVHAVVDNSVAVAEQNGVPTVIVLGGDATSDNHLVAQPHIKRVEDLRGATILVDSPDTAYALQLRKILRLRGLEAGRDYSLKPLGQTQKRFEAMRTNKDYAATMMALTDEARRLGFHSLGAVAEVIGPYQGSGVFTTRRWAEANPDAVVGYLAGYLYTLRWIRDAAHKDEILGRLAKAASPDAANQTYARLVAQAAREPVFDVQAFKTALALRAEIEGTWGGQPPAPERYYDLSYSRKALALLGR